MASGFRRARSPTFAVGISRVPDVGGCVRVRGSVPRPKLSQSVQAPLPLPTPRKEECYGDQAFVEFHWCSNHVHHLVDCWQPLK